MQRSSSLCQLSLGQTFSKETGLRPAGPDTSRPSSATVSLLSPSRCGIIHIPQCKYSISRGATLKANFAQTRTRYVFAMLRHRTTGAVPTARNTTERVISLIFVNGADMNLQDQLRQRGSKVKSLVCHPGNSATNIQVSTAASGKGNGLNNRMFSFMANSVSQSSADGCLPLLACAVSPEAQSGDFYIPGKEGPVSTLLQVPPTRRLACCMVFVDSVRNRKACNSMLHAPFTAGKVAQGKQPQQRQSDKGQ